MTTNKNNTSASLWIAIDVAKTKHDILIEYPNGTQKILKIMSTLSDFNRLAEIIKASNLPAIVGLEASGYYHRTLAYFLLQQNFEVKLISSIATARTREAQYNSTDKNDPKDTQVILYLLKAGITQHYHDPLIHQMNDAQEISNTYYQVSLRKTKLQHSIVNHYLTLYFPEAEKYFCSTRAQWFGEFFYHFPCPEIITQYTLEQFIEKASPLAGRKVDKRNWLKDLYKTAENSIGLPVSEETQTIKMFRSVLQDFAQLCQKRKEIEEVAETYLSENEDYQRLKTVPGIGPVIALTILAEVGNLKRFGHYRQFLKYCGFDLATKQSGNFRGKSTLSKRGNARLRKMFWLAATVAIRMRENTFRKKFENYIKGDPSNADLKRKAYTAVAAKMARVAYSMIKTQTDYLCTHQGQG